MAIEKYRPFDYQNISVHVALEILSFLYIPSLMKCCAVSKQFDELTDENILWKDFTVQDLTNLFPNLKIRVIDKEVWEKFVDQKKWKLKFDGKAVYNKQVIRGLKKFSTLSIEGNAGITLLNLSQITSSVTFNTFIEIAESLQPDGMKFFAPFSKKVKEYFENQLIDMKSIILLTNCVLNGSRQMTYEEQNQLVQSMECELPEASYVLIATVFAYLMNNERLFPQKPNLTFTRCANTVEFLDRISQMIVGSFGETGFQVTHDFNNNIEFYGAAAMQKC